MNHHNIKFFEIRDKASMIPVMGIKMFSEDGQERYLLGRAGYGHDPDDACIMLVMISTQECRYDPYEWGKAERTMKVAHKFIQDKFDSLPTGSVIDVEFILGETKEKKKSERFDNLEKELK